MFKFFRKSKLAGMLYIQVMAILLASAVSCVAWFSSVQTSINTDIPSSILTSYFHSGTGTLLDPYVITKPVHYYNLVNLWENNYDGFDVEGGPYFQLGYKFDTVNYQFESYDNNGVLIEDTYTTHLNMNYYSGNRILMPIGSGTSPFNGHIEGYGLTVQNVHVSGNGRSDIGIFGYVTAEATIENVYYDNVIIDCSTPDLNDTTDAHEGSHPYNSYVGYLAGHTVDANSWSNVYINNCRFVNSEEAEFTKKNNYGYFGCVGEYEAEEPSSNINYNSTLRASDVYDYFNEGDHYGDISGKGLATRNTEYPVGSSDIFSDAVTSNSTSYTMTGDTSGGSQAKDYSLSTVGYQSNSVTYDLSYGTNHLDLDASTVETTTSPDSQASSGSAGKYMYWDATTSQWVYYITQMSQGGSVVVDYNCFFISWENGGVTKYFNVNYSNDNYSFSPVTLSSAPAVETYPGCVWVLKDSSTSVGVSSLSSNGGSEIVRFYSPEYQKYLYCAQNSTPSLVDSYEDATAFTIGGPNSNIHFGTTPFSYFISDSGSIKGAVPNASNPALFFDFSGGVTTTEEDPDANEYNLVTSEDEFVEDGIYIIVDTNGSIAKAMGATQNSNNRAAVNVTVTNNQVSFSPGLGQFQLVGSSTGWSFLDLETNKYLYTASSNTARNNYLRDTETLTEQAKYTFIPNVTETKYKIKNTASGYDQRYIAYNTDSGANIFAAYKEINSFNKELSLFLRDEALVGYTTIAGAFQYSATTGAIEDQLVSYSYDVYRKLLGSSEYVLFDIAKADVSLMIFDFPNSQVTISWPEDLEGYWELVTNDSTLAAGDQIVIAASGYAFAMSETQKDVYRDRATITKIADPPSITFTDVSDVCSFTLGGASGAWNFYDSVNNGYLYAASSGSNDLGTQTTNTADGQWTISISSNIASIVAIGTNTRKTMSYNHSATRFSCYANVLQTLALYRWVAPTEYDGVPVYIGDEISEDYDPQYIDVVGGTTFSSTSFNIGNYYSSIYSIGYYDNLSEDMGIGTEFFNTFYASDAIVVTVKKTGLLDLGTLVLSYTGSATPMLTKGKLTSGGATNGIEIGPTGFKCPDLDPTPTGYQYSMSFSPHNILKSSYCTLDAEGNIYSTHDVDGTVTLCQDETFDNSKIDSYILMITNNSVTEMNVSEVDFTFKTIPGNTGDFGSVGYRTATYIDGANSNSVSTQVIGTILNIYYVVEPEYGQQVYCKVIYDVTTQTYNVTFYSTVACEFNVFNYDTSTYDLYVNGVQYYEGSNVIQISATAYNSSTWV